MHCQVLLNICFLSPLEPNSSALERGWVLHAHLWAAARSTCSRIQRTSLTTESSRDRKSTCVLFGSSSTRLFSEDSELQRHSRNPELLVKAWITRGPLKASGWKENSPSRVGTLNASAGSPGSGPAGGCRDLKLTVLSPSVSNTWRLGLPPVSAIWAATTIRNHNSADFERNKAMFPV